MSADPRRRRSNEATSGCAALHTSDPSPIGRILDGLLLLLVLYGGGSVVVILVKAALGYRLTWEVIR